MAYHATYHLVVSTNVADVLPQCGGMLFKFVTSLVTLCVVVF